MIATAAIK